MADSLYKAPEDYLLASIQRLQDLGSAITDFTVGGGARTFFEAVGATVSLQSSVAEQLRQDSYLATATGDALDAKAGDFQVARKAAVAAVGTIRISRANPADTTVVSIPAGWSTLLTVPQTGQQPAAFITTADANFTATDAHIDVAAAAVEGGTDGNIPLNTKLLPQNPVNGFSVDGGFIVQLAFTGGVDAESDDALRARVPIEVQGRVKGTSSALLAAALRVPGVTSANVLEAGDVRPNNSTVTAGHCEVYYQGDASLLSQVQSEVELARVAGQNVSVFVATAVDLVVDLHVFCLPGVDHTALSASVLAALQTTADAGVNGIVRASAMVQAVHSIDQVITVNVPFTDLRKSTDTDNTFGDVDPSNIAYARLTSANTAITVTDLT